MQITVNCCDFVNKQSKRKTEAMIHKLI